MLPHLSAGAGQGVEDAFVLARLLGDSRTNVTNLEASQLWYLFHYLANVVSYQGCSLCV